MPADFQRPKAYNCAIFAIEHGACSPLEAWLSFGAEADGNMLAVAIAKANSDRRDPGGARMVGAVARNYIANSPAYAEADIRVHMHELEAAPEENKVLIGILETIIKTDNRVAAENNIIGNSRRTAIAHNRN